jgi:hypothetical protein
MKIYIVEEYDATFSYESGADEIAECRSIVGAFFDEAKARAEVARHNGGRYMRWEVVSADVMDADSIEKVVEVVHV